MQRIFAFRTLLERSNPMHDIFQNFLHEIDFYIKLSFINLFEQFRIYDTYTDFKYQDRKRSFY